MIFEGDDLSNVRGLVAAGLGVAVVPAPRAGSPEAVPGPVTYLEILDEGAAREIFLTWSAERRLLPATDLFRRHVLNRAAAGCRSSPSNRPAVLRPARARPARRAALRVHPSVRARQSLRATPQIASTSRGSALASARPGRHREVVTTPGGTSVRASKKRAISSGLRRWYELAESSL